MRIYMCKFVHIKWNIKYEEYGSVLDANTKNGKLIKMVARRYINQVNET